MNSSTHAFRGSFLFLVLTICCALQGQIEIPTVLVGDAGNPADTTGYGAVDYEYYIGKYEVTNAQYAAFLNAVAATDDHDLYDISMSGTYGGITRSGTSGSYTYTAIPGRENHPVNYVSFWDAARFTNWLTTGNTESGVYKLHPSGIAADTISRDEEVWRNGGIAIATENEWYKAAYYSGSPTSAEGNAYWLYPFQSNSLSISDANYGSPPIGTAVVGSYTESVSYYGTYDQGGNLYEWNDVLCLIQSRVIRGGGFGLIGGLESTDRLEQDSSISLGGLGFRISKLAEVIPLDIVASLEVSTDGQSWSPCFRGIHTMPIPNAHFQVSVAFIDNGDRASGSSVYIDLTEGLGIIDVQLMSSPDLVEWTRVNPGGFRSGRGRFFRVEADDVFILIPAGYFEMGDAFGEGSSSELPVHSVYLSDFYIQSTEVTKGQWDDIAAWAENNGYEISPETGIGKSPDHPVAGLNWYECAIWLNAWSEREGLTPVYYVNGEVMRSGNFYPEIDYTANGYRLPTEAEWEKAARGSLIGKRFPSGDIISHENANYKAYAGAYEYDVSQTEAWEYHPDWIGCGTPFTSPVKTFPRNGFGLYEMSGNLGEWCGDWYSESYYSSSPDSNPIGPTSGSSRVVRGGSYSHTAYDCRVSHRSFNWPSNAITPTIGFRAVRPIP